LSYAAQFLGNTGNYKSFGDSKFIPRLASEKFAAIAKTSPEARELYETFKDDLYESSQAGRMHLGYPDAGHVSTYYPDSPDITKDEITMVFDFIKDLGLMPENARLRKTKDGYDFLIASAVKDPATRDLKQNEWTLENGKRLKLVFGDHSVEMGKIARNLTEAKKYALNDEEDKMMGDYVKAFHDGSMFAHKDSQRHWIRDKGPMVECNIGFIETYRDPRKYQHQRPALGCRGCLFCCRWRSWGVGGVRRHGQQRADSSLQRPGQVCTRPNPKIALGARVREGQVPRP